MNEPDDVKMRIMETAHRTLFRYGIKRLIMDDLAAQLGMSKKTLYTYFSCKKKLVEETMDCTISRVFSKQDEIMKKADSPIDKLMAIFLPILEMLGAMDPVLMKDLNKFYPDLWQKLDEKRRQRFTMINQIITDGVEQGIFIPIHPDVLTNIIMVTMFNFINPQNLGQLNLSPYEAFKTLYRVLFLGILHKDHKQDLLQKIEVFNN